MGHQFASGQEVKESVHLRLVYHWCKHTEKQVDTVEKFFFYTNCIAVGLISQHTCEYFLTHPLNHGWSWKFCKIRKYCMIKCTVVKYYRRWSIYWSLGFRGVVFTVVGSMKWVFSLRDFIEIECPSADVLLSDLEKGAICPSSDMLFHSLQNWLCNLALPSNKFANWSVGLECCSHKHLIKNSHCRFETFEMKVK